MNYSFIILYSFFFKKKKFTDLYTKFDYKFEWFNKTKKRKNNMFIIEYYNFKINLNLGKLVQNKFQNYYYK